MTLLDTHAIVWWLAEPAKLSQKARRAVQAAAASKSLIISAASVLEVATLARRGRLQLALSIGEWLETMRTLPELHIEPVNADIAAMAGGFDASVQGDPIDRLIIATAIVLDQPLVSADSKIQANPRIRTIW